MTERQDHTDDRFEPDNWLPQDEPADEPDFAAEDFDADMIAAAQMMQPSGDATGDPDDGYASFAETIDSTQPHSPDPVDREILKTEMARIFGARRAKAASRAFLQELSRQNRAAPDRPRAMLIGSAARRVAFRHPAMDDESADRLATRLARSLAPDTQKPVSQKPASNPGTVADLRAATQALRQAARYLLRIERQLSDQRGLDK